MMDIKINAFTLGFTKPKIIFKRIRTKHRLNERKFWINVY